MADPNYLRAWKILIFVALEEAEWVSSRDPESKRLVFRVVDTYILSATSTLI